MEDRLPTEPQRDTDYEEGCKVGQCDWSGLAADLLGLIAFRLPLVDRIAISGVCRSWRRLMLSIGRHDKLRYGLPCLVYPRESACQLFDPVYGHRHTFEMPCLLGTRLLSSRDGWLLLSKRHRTEDGTVYSIFLLNLFSKARIELPSLKNEAIGRFSMSPRPTSPSSVVVSFTPPEHSFMEIRLCRRGDAQWTFLEVFSDIHLEGILTNPAWCTGSFYCLDVQGNLGVFDPREHTWTIVTKQGHLGDGIDRQLKQYLVESDGDLLRVCDLGDTVVVLRFDTATNKWVPVKSLGDTALFVGERDCTSTKAVVESMRGKIFFNKIRGEVAVSCFLESDPMASAPTSGKLKEFLFSSWVDLEWCQPTPDELKWSS